MTSLLEAAGQTERTKTELRSQSAQESCFWSCVHRRAEQAEECREPDLWEALRACAVPLRRQTTPLCPRAPRRDGIRSERWSRILILASRNAIFNNKVSMKQNSSLDTTSLPQDSKQKHKSPTTSNSL